MHEQAATPDPGQPLNVLIVHAHPEPRSFCTALADEALKQQLTQRGAEAAPTSPDELRDFVKAEIGRWGDAVKRSGASVD